MLKLQHLGLSCHLDTHQIPEGFWFGKLRLVLKILKLSFPSSPSSASCDPFYRVSELPTLLPGFVYTAWLVCSRLLRGLPAGMAVGTPQGLKCLSFLNLTPTKRFYSMAGVRFTLRLLDSDRVLVFFGFHLTPTSLGSCFFYILICEPCPNCTCTFLDGSWSRILGTRVLILPEKSNSIVFCWCLF